MIRVLDAKYIGEKKILIRFNKGADAYSIDFATVIAMDPIKMIRELGDDKKFQRFKLDHDTVCWENGVDFAPEYLYFLANQKNPRLQKQFLEWGYTAK